MTKRISAVLGAAVLGAVALTGCNSGSGEPANTPPPTATQPPAQRQNQPEGAMKDMQDGKCQIDQKSGEWSFTGKLTNSSDKPSEYTVKVSVTKKSGGTVVASKEIVQKLDKGQSQEVKADRFAKTTDKPDELQCVTGVTVKRG